MAEVTPTKTDIVGDCYLHSWALLTADHTGVAIAMPGARDRTVQAVGTNWGAATAALEGSMDGTNFSPLTDVTGAAIEFTGNGISVVAENPMYIRARLTTVGTAAVVAVHLLSRSTMGR
jgi:hypothetical protein